MMTRSGRDATSSSSSAHSNPTGHPMLLCSPMRYYPADLLLALMCGAPPAIAQRGASCHGGRCFDRFLCGLKQQAVAAGVSQSAIAEAAPEMVYDQRIVNRDR